MFHNESFQTIIKTSDSIEELEAVKEKVNLDIARQRSKDLGGDNGQLLLLLLTFVLLFHVI